MRRRITLGLGVAATAAAALAWFAIAAPSRPGNPFGSPPDDHRTGRSPQHLSPSLSPTPASTTPVVAETDDAEDAESESLPITRVRGTVMLSEGIASDAEVYVKGWGADSYRFLLRTRTDANGRFDAMLRPASAESYVDVGARVPGWSIPEARVVVTAGVDLDVELRTAGSSTLSGRVVDPDGRPVADLRLTWRQERPANRAWIDLPRTADIDRVTRAEPLAATTTDAQGGFRIRGLNFNTWPYPRDDEHRLWLEPEEGPWGRGPDETASPTFVAYPAYRVELDVDAESDGDPERRSLYSIVAEIDGVGAGMTGGAGDRRVALVGRFPADKHSFRCVVHAAGQVHRPQRVEVVVSRESPVQRARLRLERWRSEEFGTVLITHGVRDEATGALARMRVIHWVPVGTTGSTGSSIPSVDRRPGELAIVLPAGRRRISASFDEPFGRLRERPFEVDVVAGRETAVPYVPPATGNVSLRVPDACVGTSIAVQMSERHQPAPAPSRLPLSEVWQVKADVADLPPISLPAGAYRVQVGDRSADFVVEAGATVQVDLSR
jgi:hypothetical protein